MKSILMKIITIITTILRLVIRVIITFHKIGCKFVMKSRKIKILVSLERSDTMTQTQVDYLKHLENVRHNKESEKVAAQQADAQTKQADIAEAGIGASYASGVGSLARGVGVGTLLGVALQKPKTASTRQIGFTSQGAAIPAGYAFDEMQKMLKDNRDIKKMWHSGETVASIRDTMMNSGGGLKLIAENSSTDEELRKTLSKIYGMRDSMKKSTQEKLSKVKEKDNEK